MKVTFVKVDGVDYMAQYDHDNVFVTRKNIKTRDKMMIIELVYGEVSKVRVVKNELRGSIVDVKVQDKTRFGSDAHSIVREYVPIMEGVVCP